MTRLVAIGSGKGGVGKTWFAVSLSHALTRLGLRTLLIDCDVGLANVDVQLGQRWNVSLEAGSGNSNSFLAAIQSVQSIGIDVLPARSGSSALATLDLSLAEQLLEEIQTMQKCYDLILLDLPSGNGLGMRRLMMAADEPVLLTTEEPTALTDTYAVMKAILKRLPGFLPKIVVNLVDDHQTGGRIFEGLSRVCDRFLNMRPAQLGSIRRDRCVVEAISRQTPLLQCYPNASATQDVMALATTFVRPGRKSLP